MKILITICARGGSKGIAGKNIKEVNGKPLIAYSIQTAKKFAIKYISKIVLSTDDEKIKKIASKYGLHTKYKRPSILANDTASKIDVLKDVLNYHEKADHCTFDYIIDLDVTSPLRTVNDLKKAFVMLQRIPECYNIFSVSPASRNPYFNMVEKNKNGYVKLIKRSHTITSRQKAPIVYDMNASFYIFRRLFFYKRFKTPITNKSLVYEVPHICFDVDHTLDILFLDFLLQENQLDFDI